MDVVSWNAATLIKWDGHFNVEGAAEQRCVKYLFKYITKGNTKTQIFVVTAANPEEERAAVNEIKEYLTQRYMGSSDATWRILEFDLTGREPTVEGIPVHLEGERKSIYNPGKERQAMDKEGKLEWYFKRPLIAELDDIKYADFYENYRVQPKEKEMAKNRDDGWLCTDGVHWVTRRQRGECVSRIHWVSPSRGEHFYLRLLLSNFPCRGYADLYQLGGPDCKTFQEAACAKGLLDNEKEYDDALKEAHTFLLGPALRRLFVLMCNIGAPAAVLWEANKDILSDDLHPGEENREPAYSKALIQIDRGLRRAGKSNVEHGLPEVDDSDTELARERLAYDRTKMQAEVDEWLPRLSDEQRAVFNYMKMVVEQSRPEATPETVRTLSSWTLPAGAAKLFYAESCCLHQTDKFRCSALCCQLRHRSPKLRGGTYRTLHVRISTGNSRSQRDLEHQQRQSARRTDQDSSAHHLR